MSINGYIESIMFRIRKQNNNMILEHKEHSIIAQSFSIMCQGLLTDQKNREEWARRVI